MNRINATILGFLLSWASLTYELVLAQTFVDYAIETAVWYPLVIAVFLGGLLLGVLKPVPADRDLALGALIPVEAALAVLGATGAIVMALSHYACSLLLLSGRGMMGVVLFYTAGLSWVVMIGALTGRELPLLLKMIPSKERLSVLAADYFGALAAGLFFVWVWYPHFEPFETAVIAASVNLGIVVVLCLRLRKPAATAVALLGLATVVSLLAAGPTINQSLLKLFYYYPAGRGTGDWLSGPLRYPRIEHDRSLYQTLDLVFIPPDADPWFTILRDAYSRKYIDHPDKPQGWMFFLNRDFQWWADAEEIYHEYLAHVPVLLADRPPGRVLVIGGGDGFLVRELLKYPFIRRIDLVEIDPHVVRWARTQPVLRALNEGALSDDARVHVIIDDGFRYVQRTRRRYDAVFLDLPTPNAFNTARLYSLEFYRNVRRVLADDGFLALDAPGFVRAQGTQASQRWRIYAATLRRAGFDRVTPYFSRLEENNPEARARLMAMLPEDVSLRVVDYGTAGRSRRLLHGRRQVVRQIIKDHCDSMENGFIIACPGPCGGTWHWERLPRTYVLDPARAEAALKRGRALSSQMDRLPDEGGDGVHSVWRPRLPLLDEVWSLRIPY